MSPYTHTGTGLQAATLARTSIPIIVGVASDLVGSSEEFGGARWNVTGMLFSVPKQDRKRLEGLKETVPCVPVVAFPFGTGTRPLRYRDQGETVLTGLDDSNGFLTRPKSFDRPVSALYPLRGVIRRRVPYG